MSAQLSDFDKDATTDEGIWRECAERLRMAIAAESENRIKGIDALKFRWGEQWDADVRNVRKIDGRPALTINHTNTFCARLENTLRQQRPRIKCHPVGDGADVDTASVVNGLIRHIETRSNASVAYDTGVISAINIGWGYWRIVSEYLDERSFDQELIIKPIRNPFTVYMDPSSVMPAGEDQSWCIISETMKRAEYKRRYPKAKNVEWSYVDAPGDMVTDWESKEELRLAEYYRIHEVRDTLVKFSDGSVKLRSEMEDPKYIQAIGLTIVAERPTTRREVQWFRLNGMTVIDQRVIPGRFIPVIRCEGNVLDVNGLVKRKGMIEDLKDPAQMFNYWRPLALDTPIPTPSGWTAMGDLKEGDQVFDESGKPCDVVGLSPIHIHRDCYRITLDDDSSIVADGEHPWAVEERGKRVAHGWKWSDELRSTRELKPGQHFIRTAEAIDLADADLPIHPYLLGVWLGDGCTASPRITSGERDVSMMRSLLEGFGCSLGKNTGGDRAPTFTVLGVRGTFAKCGLLGRKHIPASYLRASRKQRLRLLQGLMDTDGSVSARGQCSFTTTSAEISAGFAELLRTLGIKAVKCRRMARLAVGEGIANGRLEQDQYSFTSYEQIFLLPRKLGMTGRSIPEPRRTHRFRIMKIERVPSVPVRCIAVNSASHLFLAGESFVPTHNTAQTERYALTPKAPWVVAEGQVEGHPEWNDANQKSYSTLVYKPIAGPDGVTPLPPPQRVQPAQVEAGMSEAAQGAEHDLMSVAGMPQENPEISARVVSGNKYLQRRQGMQDLTHFQFYDNQTLSIAWTGAVLLEQIPYYYDTARMQRIIGDDGIPQMVGINQPQSDQENPAIIRVKNDLSVGRYDVVMDTGPGYATKREEAAESMVELLGTPLGEMVAQTSGDIVVRNMDFPGADEVADRLAVTIPGAMDKIIENLPKQAQTIIGALQSQMQQKDQQIQQMGLELKYGAGIAQMKEEGALKREQMKAVTSVHNTELKVGADNANSERDFVGWLSEVDKNVRAKKDVAEIQGATARDVAEIRVGGQLLNTHAEAAHEAKAADKAIEAAQKDRRPNGAG